MWGWYWGKFPVSHPFAGPILALASALAGNLLCVGSLANIIVVDQAVKLEVRITWLKHVRVGTGGVPDAYPGMMNVQAAGEGNK